MKDKVLKGIECCSSIISDCDACPYKGIRRCFDELKKDAAKVIKELIEENKSISEECCKLLFKVKEITEENERLRAVEFTCGFVKPHKVLECPIFDEIARTKADTVRTMQERLKAAFPSLDGAIDYFAKEIIEETI